MEYSFEQLSEANYHWIQVLIEKSFNANISLEEIKKKYNTSCFGAQDIGYFAVDINKQPAAYYGVFPMQVIRNNEVMLVAQSGDTMTAPEHRGKGLFIKLAQKTYALAREMGVQFVFGFPNENSFPGFKNKLNWQFTGTMAEFISKNKTLPLSELAFKFRFFDLFYKKYVSSKLSRFSISLDEGVSHFKNVTSFGILHDRGFLQYKLRQKSDYLIKYKNFYFLIKVQDHLLLGDVSFFPKDEFNAFCKALKDLGLMLGCGKTILTVNKNHWLYPYLIESDTAFLHKQGLPVGYLPLQPPAEEFSFENISLIRADSDTF